MWVYMGWYRLIFKVVGILVLYFAFFRYGADVVRDGHRYSVEEKPGITTPDIGSQGRKNINTATESDIQEVYGFGEVFSKRIVEYIREMGGIKGMEDLLDISGVGEKRYEALRESFSL